MLLPPLSGLRYTISMKSLVIGIFAIVVVGVLFFAFQVVRNSGFSNVTKVTATDSKDKETFIDINRNTSFDYPKGWVMQDPRTVPGYAPIFKNKNQDSAADIVDGEQRAVKASTSSMGYIALALQPLSKNENIAADIEIYSADLPIQEALADLLGPSNISPEINIQEVKRLTYKSGLSGFIVTYFGNGEGGSPAFRGTVYFYYTLKGIEYAFSVYIKDAVDMLNGQSGTDSMTEEQNFLNQAHESLTNMFAY